MELQLGLAPPNIPIRYGFQSKSREGSNSSRHFLKLGSSDINNIDNTGSSSSGSSSSGGGSSRKRGFDFDDETEKRVVPKTLPLLIWTNQPSDDEYDPKDLDDNSSVAIFKNDGEGLVGWPPVKTWRKNKKVRRHQIPNDRHVAKENGNGGGCGGGGGGMASNSKYVKVKMEGMGIGRKIDVGLHHSFETLKITLMRLFGILDENWKSFKLTYQDTQGDWLLAQDVPWRTFIRSLKCIKLIKNIC